MKLRFAPSPSGFLHVGNARLAVVNALLARRHGGDLLLRLDDTDSGRSTAENEAAIEADLEWLGLTWQDSFRQSDRRATYQAAADLLRGSGRLYPCFETEEELRAKREARLRARKPPIYDRAALRMTAEQRARAEANGKSPHWRFRLSDATVRWDDLFLGAREVKLGAISDPVLIRGDGMPLYTFASIVDDLDAGITHVVRGEDHVSNTGVQIDIAAALRRRAHASVTGEIGFGHLPLLLDAAGGKLSKRAGSVSLRTLRHDGVEPIAITSYLARLGTSDDPEPLDLDALAASIEPARFSQGSPRFDMRQLLALNRKVLGGLSFEAVQDRLPAGATAHFWTAIRGNLDLVTEARHWWDVVAGEIVPPPQEGEEGFLSNARDLLPPAPWPDAALEPSDDDQAVWTDWMERLRRETGRKGRALFHPLRLALTGEEQGPELRHLLALMGRSRAHARLDLAAGG